MLTDLPLAAARYAALLNTAIRRGDPQFRHMKMVDWVRHGTGIYEQVGFDRLPWLIGWPHEKALWAIDDVEERLAQLARQGYRCDYGSADSIEQVLDRYPDLVTSDERFLVTYNTLTRQSAPGWRWHKNGSYVGTRDPQAEHLGDEPDIEAIITWDIWKVRSESDVTAEDLADTWREELGDWLVSRMNGNRVPAVVFDA